MVQVIAMDKLTDFLRLQGFDMQAVVRCKDCLYFQQLGRCGARSESYTVPEGFCHWGRKKEEEEA